MGQTNVHTQAISSSITINAVDNVLRASVIVVSGVVTYRGSSVFQGTASQAITLAAGEGATITAASTNLPIDGLTVDATGGVANLLLSTQ